jgi:hypothetical protein
MQGNQAAAPIRHAYSFSLGGVRKYRVFSLVLCLVSLLCACKSNSSNSTTPNLSTDAAQSVAVTVKVSTAPDAPDDYGVVPGNAVAGANVHVERIEPGQSETTALTMSTDTSGRAVFMLEPGIYTFQAIKETHDPYCVWSESADAEVGDWSMSIELDRLWVLCE